MPVTVFIKATGEKFRGKLAIIRGGRVLLFSDATGNGNGSLHGRGDNTVFREDDVDVLAHNRDIEIQEG
jgi:hypothetical protein